MATSLAFLVRHFLNHPEHHFVLKKQVIHNPQLSQRFEALQGSKDEELWLEWFELLEHVSPALTQVLAQEVSSLLYGSSPEIDAFPKTAQPEPTIAESNQSMVEFQLPESSPVPAPQPGHPMKKRAIANSKLVYGNAQTGWRQFQLNTETGEVLPFEEKHEKACELRCHIVEKFDIQMMSEMSLRLSEHRELSYKDNKWWWKNSRKLDEPVKMDIKHISRVLPADVVDLLLDLVSPGLVFQGTNAYLSVSYVPTDDEQKMIAEAAEAMLKRKRAEKQKKQGQATPAQKAPFSDDAPTNEQFPENVPKRRNPASIPLDEPLPGDASFLSSGEPVILTKSPFAFRPLGEEEQGESTEARRAVLLSSQKMPAPRELLIELETERAGLAAWLFGRRTGKRETIDILSVNESRIFEDMGLQVTFMIESSSKAIFPWVRVRRDKRTATEAEFRLKWNRWQEQILPPGCTSTGALSRHPDLGTLSISIRQPGQATRIMHLTWRP